MTYADMPNVSLLNAVCMRLNSSVHGRSCIVSRCLRGALVVIGCALVLGAQEARGEGIQLGVMTEMPPYVYQNGPSAQQVSPQRKEDRNFYIENLAISARIGGRWDVVIAWQGIDGPDGYARLRRVVEEHRRRGLRVVVRLIENESVYSDIGSTRSGANIHSGYMAWVSGLASALAGKVDIYLVGNEPEVNLANNYGWVTKNPKELYVDYADYRVLLLTAVRAIREADPAAQIANGGFSDKTLALAYAYDLYRKQGMAAAQEAWRKWKEIGGDAVEGRVGLWRLLTANETERRVAFLNHAIEDPAGSDLFQVHYYGGWRAVPELMAWLQQRMASAGQVRPVVACEVGFRIPVTRETDEGGRAYWAPDLSRYAKSEHASEMVKSFVLFAGADVKYLLYWNMRLRKPRGMVAPLLGWSDRDTDTGMVPETYRHMAAMLNDENPGLGRIERRPGLWERRFLGARDVSVVWAEQPMRITLPGIVKGIYDMRGRSIEIDQDLTVDAEPKYIVWGEAG